MRLLALVFASTLVAWAQPEPPDGAVALEFSFDGVDALAGWNTGDPSFAVTVEEVDRVRAVAITAPPDADPMSRGGFGLLGRSVSAEPFRGRRVVLTGRLRVQDVGRDGGRLWLRADGPYGRLLALDNLDGRAASGTAGWTRYVAEVDVPDDAVTITFGALLTSAGRVWVDGLTLTDAGPADPAPFAGRPLPDAGFERAALSTVPTGWQTGGPGHEVDVDTAAWSGRQSLRVRRAGPVPQGQGPFGAATRTLPGAPGQRVRVSGYVRTEAVADGYAGLWVRADGPGGALALDNMEGRGLTGTTGWTRLAVALDVPAGATSVAFGALKVGDGTAWFDDLRVEIVERVESGGAAGDGPVSAPEPAGVAAAPGPPPGADPAVVASLAQRAVAVDGIGEPGAEVDLSPLDRALGTARVVGLGESGHGVAEFNRAKLRLVRHLHENLGVDVLAVEAPLADCHRADALLDAGDARGALETCLYQVWHTEEVLDLFEYVASTRATGRPLQLVGVDSQHGRPDPARTALLAAALAPVGLADEAERLEAVRAQAPALSAGTTAGAFADFLDGPGAGLADGYDALADRAEAAADSLGVAFDPAGLGLAVQALRSLGAFVRQSGAFDRAQATEDPDRAAALFQESAEARDRQMADNLAFVLDRAHPDARVALWAHNMHLAHGPAGRQRWMGEWARDRYGDDYYPVALFAGSGSMALNDRSVVPVARPADRSLEATLGATGLGDVFLDLSNDEAWDAAPVEALDFGRTPYTFVPARTYGAVLFIGRVSPPAYLP